MLFINIFHSGAEAVLSNVVFIFRATLIIVSLSVAWMALLMAYEMIKCMLRLLQRGEELYLGLSASMRTFLQNLIYALFIVASFRNTASSDERSESIEGGNPEMIPTWKHLLLWLILVTLILVQSLTELLGSSEHIAAYLHPVAYTINMPLSLDARLRLRIFFVQMVLLGYLEALGGLGYNVRNLLLVEANLVHVASRTIHYGYHAARMYGRRQMRAWNILSYFRLPSRPILARQGSNMVDFMRCREYFIAFSRFSLASLIMVRTDPSLWYANVPLINWLMRLSQAIILIYNASGTSAQRPSVESKEVVELPFVEKTTIDRLVLSGDDTCSVCLSPHAEMSSVRLPCNHILHDSCVREIVRHSDSGRSFVCPLCRVSFKGKNRPQQAPGILIEAVFSYDLSIRTDSDIMVIAQRRHIEAEESTDTGPDVRAHVEANAGAHDDATAPVDTPDSRVPSPSPSSAPPLSLAQASPRVSSPPSSPGCTPHMPNLDESICRSCDYDTAAVEAIERTNQFSSPPSPPSPLSSAPLIDSTSRTVVPMDVEEAEVDEEETDAAAPDATDHPTLRQRRRSKRQREPIATATVPPRRSQRRRNAQIT